MPQHNGAVQEDKCPIMYLSLLNCCDRIIQYILSCATYPRAPSYGGVRTWVEGSQALGNRALAEASNLLGCKDYILIKTTRLPTNNAQYIRLTKTQANGGSRQYILSTLRFCAKSLLNRISANILCLNNM